MLMNFKLVNKSEANKTEAEPCGILEVAMAFAVPTSLASSSVLGRVPAPLLNPPSDDTKLKGVLHGSINLYGKGNLEEDDMEQENVLTIDEFAARTGGKRKAFGPQSSLAHSKVLCLCTIAQTAHQDPDDHHAGLSINSLTSTIYQSLPLELVLKTTNLSRRLTTWINYDAVLHRIEVYLVVALALKASATKGLVCFREKSWLVSMLNRPFLSPLSSPSLLPSSPSGRARIILHGGSGSLHLAFIWMWISW
ncbi:hypothetical protein L7F22_059104 [Adiantum nelumboides]|nr:hypothetical protein [Adiantum nelumboides]